jgi:hypothetical protein
VSSTRLAGTDQYSSYDTSRDQPDQALDDEQQSTWSATLQRIVVALAEQAPGIMLAIAFLVGHH